MTRRSLLVCCRLTILLALVLTACQADVPAPAVVHAEVPGSWLFPLDEVPVRARQAMVVSTDAYASEAGLEILRAGGNALDAAIATSFALAVVNPEAGNIGGGGFMVIRMANGTTAALDYRERAPLAAARDMYLDEQGELMESYTVGHQAVGVPGTVAGLWEAHRRFGAHPWRDLLAPAVRLAGGFEVRVRQAVSLAMAEESLSLYPSTAAAFLPDGAPPFLGSVFRQPDLGRTLERIQQEGRDGFYQGEVADLIVAEMERGGGIITYEDLSRYEAAWRTPLEFRYRDHTVISMPPSSSGGATLGAIAAILEGYDLAGVGWHSPLHIHLLAEAWKRAYVDRNAYLADPDFVPMPLERMLSSEYAAERRSGISLERATPSAEVRRGLGVPSREENTTHLSVVDEQGNAVSLTTTLNSFFGSKVTVAGAGFLLNNEMDDFAVRPGSPNQYGLVQGENNAIEPGKRMLSAMTPSIVVDPRGSLLMVVGTPGGATIITNVFQQISNVVDFGMGVREAVNAPRVHHQHLPDRIEYEPGSLPEDVIRALESMGHEVQERIRTGDVYPYIGDVQAIVRLPDGSLEGASDRRRGGAAAGY